jgi:hypothetical protein
MIFWNSCEIYKPAYDNYLLVSRPSEPYLNAEFEKSSLKSLSIKLRYIPIIMPDWGRKSHPERSKARVKSGVYDCAPQLDYLTFIDGTLEAQFVEYIRGIALASPHLKKFGATPQQVADFDEIISIAPRSLYQMIIDKCKQA